MRPWYFFSLLWISLFWGNTLTLCKKFHFSILCSNNFRSINDSWLKQFLLYSWANGDFLFLSLQHLLLEIQMFQRAFPIPPIIWFLDRFEFWIDLIFYHMVLWTLILLLDYNMLLSFILLLKLSQIWLLGTLHIGYNVLSTCPYHFFFFFLAAPWSMWDLSSLTRDWHMSPALGAQGLNHRMVRGVPLSSFFDHLIFGTAKCSRLFLFSPCSNLGVNHLSKELYLFFFGKLYLQNKIWALSEVVAPRVSSLIGPLIRQSWEIYVYIHKLISIYMYIYICTHLCFYISVYPNPTVHIDTFSPVLLRCNWQIKLCIFKVYNMNWCMFTLWNDYHNYTS